MSDDAGKQAAKKQADHDEIDRITREVLKRHGVDPDSLPDRTNRYDPRGKFPFGLSKLQDDEREAIKRFGW